MHEGETGPDIEAWRIEPHIRHNNTVQTQPGIRKTIQIPFECEWPTTFAGDDPLGFRIGGGPAVEFTTASAIVLTARMTLFVDETFQTLHETQPTYGECVGESCPTRIFVSIVLDEIVQEDIGLRLIHFWATPTESVNIPFE